MKYKYIEYNKYELSIYDMSKEIANLLMSFGCTAQRHKNTFYLSKDYKALNDIIKKKQQ